MANSGRGAGAQILNAVALGQQYGGGTPSPAYAPNTQLYGDPRVQLAALQYHAAQQNAIKAQYKAAHPGGIKGLLGSSVVQGILNAVTTPQAVVTSAYNQLFEHPGHENLGNFISDIYHPSQRISGGDLLFGNAAKHVPGMPGANSIPNPQVGPIGLHGVLGFAADVASDPFSYVGVGAAAKGTQEAAAQIAEAAGREVEQQGGRKAALEYLKQAASHPLTTTTAEDIAKKVGNPALAGKIAEIHGAAQTAIQKVVKGGVNALSPEEITRFGANKGGVQVLKKGLQLHLPGMGERTIALTTGGDRLAKAGINTGGAISQGIHRGESALGDLLLGHGEARGLGKLLPNAADRALARGGDLQSVFGTRLRNTLRDETVAVSNNARNAYLKAVKGFSDDEIQKGFDLINGDAHAAEQLAPDAAARVRQVADNLNAVHEKFLGRLQGAGLNVKGVEGYTPHPIAQDMRDALHITGLGNPAEGEQNAVGSFLEKMRTAYDPQTKEWGIGAGDARVTGKAATRAEADRQISQAVLEKLQQSGDAGAHFLAEHPDFAQAVTEGGAPFFSSPREAMQKYASSFGRRIAQANAGTKAYLAGFGSLDSARLGLSPDDLTHLLETTSHETPATAAEGALSGGPLPHTEDLFQAAEGAPSAAEGLSLPSPSNSKWLTTPTQAEATSINQNLPEQLGQAYDATMAAGPAPKSTGEALTREMSFAADSQIDRAGNLINDPHAFEQFGQQLNDKLSSLPPNESIPLKQRADEWTQAFHDAGDDPAMKRVAAEHLQAVNTDAALRQAKIAVDMADEKTLQRLSTDKALHEQMSRTLIDNAQNAATYTSLVPGILTPKDVADQILQFEKFQRPDEMGKFWRNWTKTVQYIKRWQIATPGFLVRNVFGGAFNNALADIDWGSYKELIAAEGKTRLGRALDDTAEIGKSGLTEQGLHDALHTIITPGQAVTESGLGTAGEKLASGGRHFSLNPLSTRNPYIRAMTGAQGDVELLNRGALAWDVMKKGGSLDDAVAAVQKYHFNFRDLSHFDQTAKRFLPFWTYMSRNLPLQVEMAASNPKWYARYEYLRRNVEAQSSADPMIPGYFGANQAIRLPEQANGGHLYMFPTLPMRDLNLLQSPLDALGYGSAQGGAASRIDTAFSQPLGQVTPLITGPLEGLMGREVYNDIPLADNKAVPLSQMHVPSWLQGPLAKLPGGAIRKDPTTGKYYMTQRDFYVLQKVMPVLAQYQRGASGDPKFAQQRTEYLLRYFLGLQLRYDTTQTQNTYTYLNGQEATRLRGVSKSLAG